MLSESSPATLRVVPAAVADDPRAGYATITIRMKIERLPFSTRRIVTPLTRGPRRVRNLAGGTECDNRLGEACEQDGRAKRMNAVQGSFPAQNPNVSDVVVADAEHDSLAVRGPGWASLGSRPECDLDGIFPGRSHEPDV